MNINVEEVKALLRLKNKLKGKKYRKILDEIKLRQNMVVLISFGELLFSDCFVYENEVVIITNEVDIKIPLHIFCSEQWKEHLLESLALKRGIDKYNSEWIVEKRKNIVTTFFKQFIFVTIGLIPILIKGKLPFYSNIICISCISVIAFAAIANLILGIITILHIYKSVKIIKEQLSQTLND